MVGEPDPTNNNTILENARVGYQTALLLHTAEGASIWSKFNAMMVTNGILVALIGIIAVSQNEIIYEFVFIPALGILFSILWTFIIIRGFDYHFYWLFSARELEEKYLSDCVKTICRGGEFADNNGVSIEIDGKMRYVPMTWWGQVPSKKAVYCCIFSWIALYFYLLIYFIHGIV